MNATAAATAAKSPDFVLSRVFDAPRDLVWKCFTEARHMEKWWGPKGVTAGIKKLELRPGGMCHYSMTMPDGTVMWGKFVYREITPPERIVGVTSFSDEHAGMGRHPMAPTWPLEMLAIFTFEEQPGGKTKFTVRWSPINPTAEEQKMFDTGHDSMRMGWGGSLEQLEAHLAQIR